MAEKVIVRQDSDFETRFEALDPEAPDPSPTRPVQRLHDLTPYGMLLAGLGTCTTILLNSYARRHGMALRQVEMRVEYRRDFKEDCEKCGENDRYEESIDEEILLTGELSPAERQKLLLISRRCPIHKILEEGLRITSRLAEEEKEKSGG